MQENIVKRTCKELGITYKELGEAIGYSEGAIKTATSTNNISAPMQKAIELYLTTLGKSLDDADVNPTEQNLVKEVCSVLGITQKELAEIIGITPSAISQWGDEIPKTAKVALELMLENKQLKADIKTLLDAQAIAKKYT